MNRTVVVMPALNAEASVSAVVKGLRKSLPSAHVIGINDGSTDGTATLLRSLCDTTIDFPKNCGKGVALQRGFAAAIDLDCTEVVTVDSDGQHDPAFAPSILDALKTCHIAIGTRDLGGEQMPRHRRLANFLSTTATRLVSGGAVSDSQSGFRGIRREVLNEIHATGDRYEFETDFIIRAAHAGFCITNVPISTIYGAPSYFREVRDAARVVGVLWSHRAGVLSKPVPRTVAPSENAGR
jgi:glycosyltransferase involved in cell wall biosynthesis